MTPTAPTAGQLATFRHDLTRIEFALETARSARQRSFSTEAHEAEARARETLSQLLDVLDVWIADAEDPGQLLPEPEPVPPVAPPAALAAPSTPIPMPPAPEAVVDDPDPVPAPEPDPTTPEPAVAGQWGRYDVKTLRGQRFVRCPELLCGVRITLCADDETEADVAGAIDAHRTSCNARRAATATSKKRARSS